MLTPTVIEAAVVLTHYTCRQAHGQSAAETQIICITFGMPMLGDLSLGQGIEARQWSCDFLHIIKRHDMIVRVLLAKFQGELHIIAFFGRSLNSSTFAGRF